MAHLFVHKFKPQPVARLDLLLYIGDIVWARLDGFPDWPALVRLRL
jgi:hypothetical protein